MTGPALSPAEAGARLLPDGFTASPEDIAPFLNAMILSASGWRTVFAADGEEESRSGAVRPEHLLLSALAAAAFARALNERGTTGAIVVGQDTRPTGPGVAQAAIRMLLSLGVPCRYLFAVASPEIMAYAQSSSDVGAFLYVSASHNPAGHNGLKMGLGDGGVGCRRNGCQFRTDFAYL